MALRLQVVDASKLRRQLSSCLGVPIRLPTRATEGGRITISRGRPGRKIGEGASAPSPVMRRIYFGQQTLNAGMFSLCKGRCVLCKYALQ